MTTTPERGRTPVRRAGFAPIESYAALGDGRTVALVAEDGAIDWFPTASLDGHPTFAAVLDPERGGAIRLSPAEPFTVSRHYFDGTNVLCTAFRTAHGELRVTDSLNTGRAGRLPWTELARRVEVLRGPVEVRWQIAPGSAIGPARPWTWTHSGGPMLEVADQFLAVRCRGLGEPDADGSSVTGHAVLSEGDHGLLALVATTARPTVQPAVDDIDARIDSTIDFWRRWSTAIESGDRWQRPVRRAALALKLLIHAPTGAIAGAATTSLPEVIGGERNFDYRYAWIRDASFAIDALATLDLHEEVHAAVCWLLESVARTAPDLKVYYRLDGSAPDPDQQELRVVGYRDSRPALAGNSAAGQMQLGTFGDLFDAVFRYTCHGGVLDPRSAHLLCKLAERACDLWPARDAGIWELGSPQHYTISKMSCWVALNRAAKLAEAGQLTSAHVARWQHEAAAIRAWIDANCWSEEKRAYTFYAGSDELDASLLLAARTGFCAPDDRRLSQTVDAIGRELSDGPLLYRYSSMRGEEGCFLACCFWRVQALAYLGRRDEAAALMDDLVTVTNDVGLLSEEIEPESRELRGNFPQGLSHLALITAAAELTG